MDINLDNIIYPYFVTSGKNRKQEIKNFPGVFRFSVDRLTRDIRQIKSLGINKVLLFGIPDTKDNLARAAYQQDNIVSLAIEQLKAKFKGLTVITDVCLCAYTEHGHCAILKKNRKEIDHKATLDTLAKIALSHARSGTDWVAPSAMAKKQVWVIRKTLGKNGLPDTKIMGYSAKFASNFYGPFRNAADSSPKFGDRRGYQLDYAQAKAALREVEADIKEGADTVMVKPALGYLDVIRQVKSKFDYPLAAYNVSGEYAMVKYGAKIGLWDERKMVFEIITAIKRAGADFIITYHARDLARWLRSR